MKRRTLLIILIILTSNLAAQKKVVDKGHYRIYEYEGTEIRDTVLWSNYRQKKPDYINVSDTVNTDSKIRKNYKKLIHKFIWYRYNEIRDVYVRNNYIFFDEESENQRYNDFLDSYEKNKGKHDYLVRKKKYIRPKKYYKLMELISKKKKIEFKPLNNKK